MKWDRGSREDNFEDIRGQAPRGRSSGALRLGGGGAVVAIVALLVSQLFGVDLGGLIGGGGGGSAPRTQSTNSGTGAPSSQPRNSAADPDDELREFTKFVNNNVQDTFKELFQKEG